MPKTGVPCPASTVTEVKRAAREIEGSAVVATTRRLGDETGDLEELSLLKKGLTGLSRDPAGLEGNLGAGGLR